MGRTLPSFMQVILGEQAAFARFRRALRREDQRAFDDLFAAARLHVAEAAYASHALPFEVMLLAMLIEQHKELMRLREALALNAPPPLPPGNDGEGGDGHAAVDAL